jgi:hypothetical protein
LKYNSDSYYDRIPQKKQQKKESTTKAAPTRKRKASTSAPPASKKRKTAHLSHSGSPIPFTDDIPPVVWVPQAQRKETKAKSYELGKTASILGDWRKRFAGVSGFPKASQSATPEVLDAGYEGEDEELDEQEVDELYGLEVRPEPGERPENRHIMLEDDEEEEEEPGGLELDPEALKKALRQHLQAQGVNMKDIDESMLLQMATRMFANEGEADDIAGELADNLLQREEDEEEESGGFVGWIANQVNASQNGAVKLDQAEAEAPQLPTPSQSSGHSSRSANDVLNKAEKRKADSAAIGQEAPKPKRPAHSFAAPTAASKARTVSATAAGSRGKGKKKA